MVAVSLPSSGVVKKLRSLSVSSNEDTFIDEPSRFKICTPSVIFEQKSDRPD